ncbi:RCC1 domain-containing protein [Pseudomonas oryziphila]|uniref:Alpha-tubulin suppressor n=1 Tax=Pseudomonas oryziphila TaxID=2894079 RepID=A0ABN5TFX4_9PSED|nr:hypothetical protein [Pseudomonas oryziphila]AZL74023.1 hypothetical protein EI693_13395 [Pseudomonas oryziphila]
MGNVKALPVAEDVVILGEPIGGGTLRGSYKYSHLGEIEEGNSDYVWTADGAVISNTADIRVAPEDDGKELLFTVTPRDQNGAEGAAAKSAAKKVYLGFQRITDEENTNSFMKQHGNFSFYTPEPSDRIFVSTGGAFSLLDGMTQNTYVRGQKEFGATVPEAIKGYLQNNPAMVLYSTERDFSALVPLGNRTQLLAWGSNIPQNIDLSKLRDIKSVYANGNAFAFIYNNMNGDNQWIGAIGNAASGSTIPADIHLKLVTDPPVAIYSTYSAFAVLTTKGKVYAWGNANEGGVINADAQAYLNTMTVSRIITNMSAFCAIDDTGGMIVPWGNAANGGNIPAAQLNAILNQGGVKSVIAARAAFCAITQGRAIAVCWGNATQGGAFNNAAAEQLAARGNIVMCKAATWAFTIISSAGQVGAWGVANSGGTVPPSRTSEHEVLTYVDSSTSLVEGEIKDYFESRLAQITGVDVVAQDQKSILAKAADDFSTSVQRVTHRLPVGDGVVSVFGNDSSFFCMAQDEDQYTNNLWVWGQANGGGAMPVDVRQALMASRIRAVYCTNGAYGVICSQGSTEGTVLVWGASLAQSDAGEIPKTPPEIAQLLGKGIIELYSIKRSPPVSPTSARVDPSFAARHISGSYVLWGGNVDNQVFTPQDHESFK